LDELQNPKHPIEPEVRKHLEMLPEPYRTQAIENAERLGELKPWDTCEIENRIARAIGCAFVWGSSPQGGSYWVAVYDRAQLGEFDPKPKEVRIPFSIDRYDSGDFIRYETRDGRVPEHVYVMKDRDKKWPLRVIFDIESYTATIEGCYLGDGKYTRDLFMVVKEGAQ
jgi:hypothetical protein